MATTPLNRDDTMIERMEIDLVEKATQTFEDTDIGASVYGVFNLDDLENKLGQLLQSQGIGIGVAYARAVPYSEHPERSAAPGRSGAARMVLYEFMVILAVPTDEACMIRYKATQLLTMLRNKIHGSLISQDDMSRYWNFQGERPLPEQSDTTMLYYAQSWQVAIVLKPPQQ